MADPVELNTDLVRIHELLRQAKWDEAEALCQSVATAAPQTSQVWFFLGLVALNRRALDQAEAHFRHAIALDDRQALYWSMLGTALRGQAQWPEAADACREAIARDDRDLAAWSALATSELMRGRLAAAEEAYERSLALAPERNDVAIEYALLLSKSGQARRAIEVLTRILEQETQNTVAWIGLGHAQAQAEDFDAAASAFRKALELTPGEREARHNLAVIRMKQWSLVEAEQLAREIIRDDPHPAEAWSLLGTIQRMQGRVDEAIASLQRAVQLEPNAERHSRLLLTMQYAPDVSPQALLASHFDWDAADGRPMLAAAPSVAINRDNDRPLRLAFVSADFGIHPTAFLTLGPIEALDKRQCSVVCYRDGGCHDDMTARFKAAADLWRVTRPLSNEALAEQVRQDQIDVLIDLMGHTGSRLPVFAMKPAPMSIAWQGYPGTTGLAAIDFLLADRFHVQPGEEPWYRESILRMPHDYVCYTPLPSAPDVWPLPALTSGRVTFGCFNNPAKFSPQILDAWAEILRRVAGSQLLLKYGGLDQPQMQSRLLAEIERRGIDRLRIVMEGWSPPGELLAQYGRVDLALDTQPYSGGVTTCDALWMGVPVVTYPGQTFAGRHAVSHLINAGYEQFVASNQQQYVEVAVEWAGRLDELAAMRTEMRERVKQSPLCDAAAFTRDLLSVIRAGWRSLSISKRPV